MSAVAFIHTTAYKSHIHLISRDPQRYFDTPILSLITPFSLSLFFSRSCRFIQFNIDSMCILHTSRLLRMKPGEIHNTPPSAHTNIHPSEQDAAICYPPCYFLEGKLSRPRTFAQPLDALACARDPCSKTAAQYSITIRCFTDADWSFVYVVVPRKK